MLKLYESEWLVYVDRGEFEDCEYWVLRCEGPSPLFTRYPVKKKHIPIAIAIFKDHPDGIRKVEINELSFKKKEAWDPQTALEHNAETVTLDTPT